MSARWAWAGVFAGAVAASVAAAPAAWVDLLLRAVSAQRLQLHDAQGTVWRGQGRLVVSTGASAVDAVALPGTVLWRVTPGWDAMRVELQAGCCTTTPLQLDWWWQGQGWALSAADGASRWPLALLAGLGAPWNTIQASGQLQVKFESAVVEVTHGAIALRGSTQLDLIDVSSKLSTLKPVGSFRLRLTGAPGNAAPTLDVRTLDGALNISGQGQWTGALWRFRGEASAAPEFETVLGNLLNILGRRQGAKTLLSSG